MGSPSGLTSWVPSFVFAGGTDGGFATMGTSGAVLVGPWLAGWPGVWRGSCQAASTGAIASARAANSRSSAPTAAPPEPYTVTLTCVRVKLRSG